MKKRVEFGEKFIYCIIALWLGTELLVASNLDYILFWKKSEVNDVVANVVLVLLVIHIVLFQEYQYKELAIISLISVFFLMASIKADYNLLLSTWIFIIASKYINIHKAIAVCYYVQIVMILLILYLFVNGYISDSITYRGAIVRHSLGFSHPNLLGIRVFMLLVCRCFYRENRLNIFDLAIVVGVAVFIKKIANSQTAFYSLLMLSFVIFFHILSNYMQFNIRKITGLIVGVTVVIMFGSIFLSYIDVKKISLLNTFDVIMSRRFSQCHRTLGYYGIKLLGQNVQMNVKNPFTGLVYHFWLDNAYMSLLLRFGPIVLVIFSYLYISTMLILRDMDEFLLVEIMCLYALYGIMENNFYSLSQNLFLLLLSIPVYKGENVGEGRRRWIDRVHITW